MTPKKVLSTLVVFAALTVSGAAVPVIAQTADPTLHQVYEAADAGRMGEAQAMMDRVLRDHPDSARAHYVEAELLAKQGRYAPAGSELQTAERLAPGLPFAKPEAVTELRRLVAGAATGRIVAPAAMVAGPARSGGVPWVLIIIVAGIVLLIVTLVRATRRLGPASPQGALGYMPPGPTPGVGPGMPGYPMGGMPMGGGMGSGILGGLATGAALGAGVVAGEELMHHFTDPNRQGGIAPLADSSGAALPDNMGGQDFGVSDGGSWDDSGSSLSDGMAGGGGDDWT